MGKICVDDQLIKRLRFLDRQSLQADQYPFPDFLIVGPQKTATTWLTENLRRHPQIYIPWEKELFFFNLLDKPKHPLYRSNQLRWYAAYFRLSRLAILKQVVRNSWQYKGLYYRRVFGEATASYAAMEAPLIQELVALCPTIKVIFSIRNPIQRAWSHAKMDLMIHQKKPYDAYSFDDFKAYYQSEYVQRCGFFTQNIERWKKFLRQEQIKILISEHFRSAPMKTLKQIFSFLDVNSSEHFIDTQVCFCQANASTIKLDIPEKHANFLHDLYKGEIEKLNVQYHTNYTTSSKK